MTGLCPGCGASPVELSPFYKQRKFPEPLCWCCRMRRHNQINEGFDPFETEPDADTREMIAAFSTMAERQIAREERTRPRVVAPLPRPARPAPAPALHLHGESRAAHSCPDR